MERCRKLLGVQATLFSLCSSFHNPPTFSLSTLDKISSVPCSLRSLFLKRWEVSEMLKHISSSLEYRAFLRDEKDHLGYAQLKRLDTSKFHSALHKLRKLDVDLAVDVLFPLYSVTGRPAHDPAVLIRSFILMQHLGYLSIHNWCADLSSDSLLQWLIGSFSPPGPASHYDFINRLTHSDPHLSDLLQQGYYTKPSQKKPKNHDKLINYSHSETLFLADKYKNGAEWDRDRMIYTLQSLFNALAVIPSSDMGFIESNNLILSGDGSSLHIHASPFGHKVKLDKDGNPLVRYSAPDADIGWDSDLESYYLGYTLYNISYHNPHRSVDLPIYIDLEKASRHDALTTISASARLFDMNPDIHPRYMCFDAASDSLAIFQFFRHKNIIPIIDRNQRSAGDNPFDKFKLNENGVPVCPNGTPMYDYGYDIQRKRRKFRCPLRMNKISSCPFANECSSSAYGRTIYVNDGDDIRLFGPVPYRSEKWKEIYRNRTSTERMNTRILNDYHLHQMKIRNGSKHAFFAIFAGINIHLDAWIKDEL